MKLLAGRHQLVATRRGYVTESRALDLPAGKPVVEQSRSRRVKVAGPARELRAALVVVGAVERGRQQHRARPRRRRRSTSRRARDIDDVRSHACPDVPVRLRRRRDPAVAQGAGAGGKAQERRRRSGCGAWAARLAHHRRRHGDPQPAAQAEERRATPTGHRVAATTSASASPSRWSDGWRPPRNRRRRSRASRSSSPAPASQHYEIIRELGARRHGPGVPRARHQARPPGRDQVPAPSSPEIVDAAPRRGARDRAVHAREHRRHLRGRRAPRACRTWCSSTSRARRSRELHGDDPLPLVRSVELMCRSCARSITRTSRHRPPRPQARQHLRHRPAASRCSTSASPSCTGAASASTAPHTAGDARLVRGREHVRHRQQRRPGRDAAVHVARSSGAATTSITAPTSGRSA